MGQAVEKYKSQQQAGGNLARVLQGRRPQLERLLGEKVGVDKFLQAALYALNRDGTLAQCSQPSIVQSLYDAALLGLEISGALGEAYLVPFKGKCQLIVGYRGLEKLAMRSGHLASPPWAEVVKEGDFFDYQLGSRPFVNHRPASGDRGEVTFAYAVADMSNSDIPRIKVIDRLEIDSTRARSATASSKQSPWTTDYEAMARKTAIRRLCSTLPLSSDVTAVVAREEGGSSVPLQATAEMMEGEEVAS